MGGDDSARTVTVRTEREGDADAVHALNVAAFGQPDEADLVDRLRTSSGYLALVAIEEERVVGHIAFSPVTLTPPTALDVRGLAPMAVAPDCQRKGIGTALVRAGLAACRDDGAEAVVVLGHPAYYPRFGFEAAARRGIACEYDVPPEAFMAMELVPGALDGVAGVVRYASAFAE